MGNPFVGIVHPCKIYNILRVGSPLLYIGPEPSHVSEMMGQLNGKATWRRAGHGQADLVVQQILEIKAIPRKSRSGPGATTSIQFSAESLLPKLVNLLESVAMGPEGGSETAPLPTAVIQPSSRRR